MHAKESWNNVKKSFSLDQMGMLYIDVFYYISLFLNICTNNFCYRFEGYAYAADSLPSFWEAICCCGCTDTLLGVVSGISMLHFGLGCKTTQFLRSKQENSLAFAPAATALACPLTGVPAQDTCSGLCDISPRQNKGETGRKYRWKI